MTAVTELEKTIDTRLPLATVHGLFHIAIKTENLAATRKFWTDIIGLREFPRPDFGYPGAWLGCTQPGGDNPPAVGVLRQAVVLAKTLIDGQVLGGAGEVVALEQHPGQSDVHVGRSAQGLGARRRCGQLERPLIGPYGSGEPSLSAPDVAEGDGAAEDVGEESGASEARRGFGICGVGAGKVTRAPGGDASERACCRAREGVVRRRQRKRSSRACEGAVEIRAR